MSSKDRIELFNKLIELGEFLSDQDDDLMEQVSGRMKQTVGEDMFLSMILEKKFDLNRLGKAEVYAKNAFLEIYDTLFEYYITYEAVRGALLDFGANEEDIADYLAVVGMMVKEHCDCAKKMAIQDGVIK